MARRYADTDTIEALWADIDSRISDVSAELAGDGLEAVDGNIASKCYLTVETVGGDEVLTLVYGLE